MFSAGFIIGTAVVAIVGALPLISRLADKNTMGSELERFIASKNPQNPGDVEKAQFEYAQLQSRNKII